MSSSGAFDAFDAGSGSFIHPESAEHFVTKAATKGTDSLGLGVAGGQAFGDVRVPKTRAAELGHGDPVESSVELTVAAAVEPMTDEIAVAVPLSPDPPIAERDS